MNYIKLSQINTTGTLSRAHWKTIPAVLATPNVTFTSEADMKEVLGEKLVSLMNQRNLLEKDSAPSSVWRLTKSRAHLKSAPKEFIWWFMENFRKGQSLEQVHKEALGYIDLAPQTASLA